MAAPKGNRNAEKPAGAKQSGHLNIRAAPRERAAWEAAARSDGKNLSQWAQQTLNDAAREWME